MKPKNLVVVGASVAAASAVLLGACSSGASDQAQEATPTSSSESTLSEEQREASKANHKGFVTAPAPKGQFNKVVVTHNPKAKCSQKEKDNGLVIDCTNVGHNVAGDAVYVRVPGKNFQIDVRNLSYDKGRHMETTQRDHAASPYSRQDLGREQYWSAPKLWTAGMGWGVGVESRDDDEPISVTIFVNLDN